MKLLKITCISALFSVFLLSLSCGGDNTGKSNKNSETKIQNENKSIIQPAADTGLTKPGRQYSFEIVRTIPHDPTAYTQGLLFYDGFLYESTGQYGSSSLRKVDPKTGKVLMRQTIPFRYFGEGITFYNGKIYMLTWQNQVCYVFDLETLTQESSFRYQGEGWGLEKIGEKLYMSDGSSSLRILNPANFSMLGALEVIEGNYGISNLNELEYVGGELLANVWMSDSVARIDISTGRVNGWLDFSPLREMVRQSPKAEAFNGIAFDKANGTLYVTGKLWPYYFEVKLKEN